MVRLSWLAMVHIRLAKARNTKSPIRANLLG